MKKKDAPFSTVHKASRKYDVHNLLGAYIVAIERIAEATKLSGWY